MHLRHFHRKPGFALSAYSSWPDPTECPLVRLAMQWERLRQKYLSTSAISNGPD
jgi:hypothetical protein